MNPSDPSPPPHEVFPVPPQAQALATQLGAAVPTLTTERLRLRAPRLADFPAYAEIALSPKGRFLMEEPTRETAWCDFTNMTAGWLLRGHGLWTVERLSDGRVVAFALLGFEPGDHEPELGYMVRPEAEGCGYATEAAGRARRYAFEALGFDHLVSSIDPENDGSVRVAKKLGGVRDTDAEAAHGDAVIIMRYRPPRD